MLSPPARGPLRRQGLRLYRWRLVVLAVIATMLIAGIAIAGNAPTAAASYARLARRSCIRAVPRSRSDAAGGWGVCFICLLRLLFLA